MPERIDPTGVAAGTEPIRARLLAGAGYVLLAFAASRLLIIAVILLSQLVITPGTQSVSQGLLPVLSDWDGQLVPGYRSGWLQLPP